MIVGIGVDLVTIGRVTAMLERHGPRLLDRCFAPGEIEQPADAAHVAALLAAKEAAFKALGTGWTSGVGWHNVAVDRRDDGTPRLSFHGAAGRRADTLGVAEAHLSLVREGDTAVAVVLLEGSPRPGKP